MSDSYTTRPVRTPGPVVVEFTDGKGQRVQRHFEDAYAARRFYGQQLKAGHNPKVCKPVEGGQQ